jgi:biotin transport system permease protein
MAQRIAFHYFPGDSFLHRWDSRCKFFGLLIVTLTLIPSKTNWLIFDSFLFIALFLFSRLPLKQFFRDFRAWAIFLFALFLFQALFTPGPRILDFSWLPLSRDGIYLGGITCWRLGIILGFATLFTAVTRPRDLRDALTWFLRPFPFIPGRRIGLMVSLTLRFFSITLEIADEVRQAHKARLGDRVRNPFRKAKRMTLPILRRSFSRAEDVTFALAARGFREDQPIEINKINMVHLLPLLPLIGIYAVL